MDNRMKNSFFESKRVSFIPISEIVPNPAQPRRVFDPDGLRELAKSIQSYGVLQPVSVRRKENGGYELIAGERRLRASKLAGLTEIPALVLGVSDEESGMIALIENLQRRDLDFIEEAEGIARLMRLYGLSQEQAAERLGKSQSAIANKLRLLRHSPRVLDFLREHGLTERHARALLRLPTDDERFAAVQYIAAHGLTVARSEQYIESLLSKKQPGSPKPTRTLLLRDVRFFLNSVDHSLALVRDAGFAAVSSRSETEDEIILTINIPKYSQPRPTQGK